LNHDRFVPFLMFPERPHAIPAPLQALPHRRRGLSVPSHEQSSPTRPGRRSGLEIEACSASVEPLKFGPNIPSGANKPLPRVLRSANF
jgi:hypothetical protein